MYWGGGELNNFEPTQDFFILETRLFRIEKLGFLQDFEQYYLFLYAY